MPNWVINRLTIEGPDAEKIVQNHIVKDKDGSNLFDFNLIHKMPEELDIIKGSKSKDGFQLYIAKINPMIDEIGTSEDKMEINAFSNRLIKALGKNANGKIPMILLRNDEVTALKLHYKNEFDDIVKLGEQAFRNLEKYGFTDWYEWRLHNWGTKWNACNTLLCDDMTTIYFDTAWSPSVPVVQKFAEKYPQLKITHDYAEEQIAFFCGKHEYENGKVVARNDFEEYSKEAYEMYFDLWGCEDEFVFDPKQNTYVAKEDVEVEMA